jgi:hypothetical protein
MGKRSSFERLPRDFYPTPLKAVPPLIPRTGPTPSKPAHTCRAAPTSCQSDACAGSRARP